VRGHRGEAHLKGLRSHPLATQYNENRAFQHKTAMVAAHNRLLSQPLMRQIRYLADQWNINGIFSPINEFCVR